MEKIVLPIRCFRMLLWMLFSGMATLSAIAQPFGGTPASFRWRQVNTDTVRIIFPEGFESEANRISTILHSLQQSTGSGHKKISLVIRDQTMLSNGYVALAPWRSEWYITPPRQLFSLGATHFPDLLAIHEWKHVQQYNQMNTGIAKIAGVLLGQQGRALANALTVPDWFFEGDAVDNETRFSQQGRGSLTFFTNQIPLWQQTQSAIRYDYLRNGSLRKYVPNHYALGYALIAYGRKNYGDSFWTTISTAAAAGKGIFYPFQRAIQKQTGLRWNDFVLAALKESKTDTIAQPAIQWITPISIKGVTDYLLPVKADDHSVWVLKKNDRAVPGFYKIDTNGKETLLTDRMIASDDGFTCKNGFLVYAAFEPDTRWGNHDETRIVKVSLATGKSTVLFHNKKWVSPDISSNGKQLLVAEIQPHQASSIVQIDEDGKELFRLSMPGYQLSEPRFDKNETHCYATIRDQRGYMSIIRMHLNGSDTVQWLMPLSNRVIAQLQIQSDTLLFTTSTQQSEELWSLIPATQQIYRVCSAYGGIYQGAILNQKEVLAAVFTGNGFRLAKLPAVWQPVEVGDVMSPRNKSLSYPTPQRAFLQHLPERNFPVTRYRQSFQPFNFHSYRPFFELPEYSFTIYGENVLSTFQHQLQYVYNQNEGSSQVRYDGIYGGTYLQPLAGFQQTWHRTVRWNADTLINFQENSAYAGIRLPLNLSGGNRFRSFTLQSTLQYRQVNYTGIAEKWLSPFNQITSESSLQYVSQVQQARQHILPRYAHGIAITYKQSASPKSAYQWLAKGFIGLPGLSPVHNVWITLAAQTRDTLQQYYFTNRFPFARGYQAIDFPDVLGGSFTYHFPIAYPERGWGQIVYLLRLRAALFYDHTVGISRRTGNSRLFNSVGAEWYFDTRWWNQLPVSLGFRYSRLLQPEWQATGSPNRWEIILPVNILN